MLQRKSLSVEIPENPVFGTRSLNLEHGKGGYLKTAFSGIMATFLGTNKWGFPVFFELKDFIFQQNLILIFSILFVRECIGSLFLNVE